MEDRPRIAVTMGDPAGVGPEIIIKTFQDKSIYRCLRPIVVGDAAFLSEMALQMESGLFVSQLSATQKASFTPGLIDVLDLKNISNKVPLGEPSPLGGKTSVEFIRTAVDLALDHQVDGITTAPINKPPADPPIANKFSSEV